MQTKLSSSKQELYAKLFSLIDLTTLNHTDTYASIRGWIEKVNSFKGNFAETPTVAAICLYPNFVSLAREELKEGGVKLAVVAGAFPSAQSFIEVKELECRMAVERGADEVDVVIPLSYVLEDSGKEAYNELVAMRQACKEANLKVILESGSITDQEVLRQAALLAMEAGADFIKTSTGKSQPAATPEAAKTMCKAIEEYYNSSDRVVGFKASGGIATAEEATLYYNIVGDILGENWLNNKTFRIGASRLANNLLTDIYDREINYF